MFGEYWITFMSRGAYAELLDFAGGDLVTLLRNLDSLHDSVRNAIPGAVTPRFKVTKVSAKTILVRYSSERAGLLPFVCGLLKALLARFGQKGVITPVKSGKNFTDIKISLQ